MIILSTLLLLISNAVSLRRDMAILYNRIAIIALLYAILQSLVCFSILSNGGIGIHGGLFHVTNITQVFHIFLYLVSILIIQLTSIKPLKVSLKLNDKEKNNFMAAPSLVSFQRSKYKFISLCKFLLVSRFSSLRLNSIFSRYGVLVNQKRLSRMIKKDKREEHLKIIEYPLILLFIISGAVFLMSTNDFISVFLSIELQSYGCAPGEVYVAEILVRNTMLILSNIFGLPTNGRYSPRVITSRKTNNTLDRVADYKRISQMGLPSLEIYLSGDSHGQDNKLDTCREAQLGLDVLSRILRHLIRVFNVLMGSPYHGDRQKSLAHFSIENKNAQGPKTINPNANVTQPRDLTAYGYNLYLMRGRSFHSSNSLTKGNNRISLPLNPHDSNTKGADNLNLLEGSKSHTSVGS